MRIQAVNSLLAASVGRIAPRGGGAPDETQATDHTHSIAPAGEAKGPQDELTISDEAQAASEATGESDEGQLTEEERQQVRELRQRDSEVRRHEQAHLAAAGAHARGGPTFTYQQGPDGQRYAIGGEVQIDTSPVPDDPEATAQKARVIRAAALAPGDPSAQDRAVAAAASKLEAQAARELREKQRAGREGEGEDDDPAAGPPTVADYDLIQAIAAYTDHNADGQFNAVA